MSTRYTNPALDAELAYRREVLLASGARPRGRRWTARRRASA